MGYGLCQYGLAQSSNVMWLDGVILLPLILLGIYRLIWKKNLWHLSLCVGISISLNWYTGGINCNLGISGNVFVCGGKKAGKQMLCIMLSVAVIGELVADSTILLKQYKLDNVEEFKSYEKNQQAQIDEILTIYSNS